jgi:hypothetical protein
MATSVPPPPIRESFLEPQSGSGGATGLVSRVWLRFLETLRTGINSGTDEATALATLPSTDASVIHRIDDLELQTAISLAQSGSSGSGSAGTVDGLSISLDSMADDDTRTLPTLVSGALGFVVIGADEERAIFSVDSSGNANLIIASANIVANADTDGKFCIGTSVANPLILRNRLGAEKTTMRAILYN